MTAVPGPALDPVVIIQGVADGLWAAYLAMSPEVFYVAGGVLTLRMGWALFLRVTAESRSEKRVLGMYARAAASEEAGAYGQSRSELRAARRAASKHDKTYGRTA